MEQGYQIIAMGHEDYAIMAESYAISIRMHDQYRPIQIVTDRPERFQSYSKPLFDIITKCDNEDVQLKGPLIKLKSHKYSKFKRTLFIDCDCILFNSIESYWQLLDKYDFTVNGQMVKTGEWYRADIADLCYKFSVPYVVKMNSGIIYFNEKGFEVFDNAWAIYEKHGNFLNHDHRGCGAPDEPYLGIAMGAMGLSTIDKHAIKNQLMLSTVNSRDFTFDLDKNIARFMKGEEQYFEPYISHFVACQPAIQYVELIKKTRAIYHLSSNFSFRGISYDT